MDKIKFNGFLNYIKQISWITVFNKKSLIIYVLFGLIIWLAHFSLTRSAGLYEDDYFFISPSFGWNFNQLFAQILNNFETWPQGRPIGFSLPPLFSFLGYKLGGLYGIYIIAFLILFLNACLVYTLAKMIESETFALMAGLAFSLFSPDTTRPFLMHATGLQPSLTFLLIASLCYLSGKRTLSYFIILGSLLTYESPFMVFLGIPLLKLRWDRALVKELIRHIVVLGALLLCVLVVRHFTGDDRLRMGNEALFIPLKVLASLIIGPLASFSLLLFMPFTVLFNLDVIVAVTILLSLIFIGWIFFKITRDRENITSQRNSIINPRVLEKLNEWSVPPAYRELVQISFVSIVLLSLGYMMSFTHFPPLAYHGRLTSVHLASSLGGALLFACLSTFLLIFFDHHRLKHYVTVVLIIYFSLAAGYGAFIQKDFVQSWCSQKVFWAATLRLVPDLEDGTVILFPYDDQAEPKYIHIHSWADPIILEQIYDFPKNWQRPPRLFTVDLNWTELIYLNGQQVMWKVPGATWPTHAEILPASNLIFLQTADESLERVDVDVWVQGREFPLKPILFSTSAALKHGPLYELFMTNDVMCNPLY